MAKSVLVVEDHGIMQGFLKNLLKKEYDVTIKDNGLEALEYLEEAENLPDVIIADINMPKMSGIDFLKNVKSSTFQKSIPVIMLSSRDTSEDRINALEAGASDYITKPFNPKELLTLLNKNNL